MLKVSNEEIKSRATELKAANKKWHFHILSPNCTLNSERSFSLILEDSSDHLTYTAISDESPKETGKELVILLHGKEVIQDSNEDSGTFSNSEEFEKILSMAKQLNHENMAWHHHMLFPDCVFNKHQGSYVIVLEDPRTNEILEILSKNEPKAELKQLEPLFYSRN